MLDFGYYNMDCMEGMKQFPDKYFDLAVVDPPYGINAANMTMGTNKSRKNGGYPSESTADRLRKGRLNKGGGRKFSIRNMDCDWDMHPPSSEYFDELFRVSKNQIIWGANYYTYGERTIGTGETENETKIPCGLPPSRGIIVWDKVQPWENFSQIEMAWTSYDCPAKLIRYSNTGGKNIERKIHPTQKPVALYEWILSRYAKEGDIILDTHVGSASSLIACSRANHKFVGFELDEYYYKLSKERLDTEMAQMSIYDFMN
jgi:site-specific DNA-methyltransferase (adenine-specific)